MFRKRASDPPAVAAKRRMREAQGKAAKRASDPPAVAAERRMREAQGKAVIVFILVLRKLIN